MKNKILNAPCTIAIALINMIVFAVLTWNGMTEDGAYMLEHGAMYVPYVLENQEYYRIITSMFLHFGIQHLLNNMLILVVLGMTLEVEIGKIKFLIIYLLSGIGGTSLSAYGDIYTGQYNVSGGASGAIFGVICALLYVAIRNRGRIGNISGRGILFILAISLYYGFSSTGVDNLAHIGGAVTGFLLGILLYWKRKQKSSNVIPFRKGS